jgi:signal transduction histidine kinase
MEQATATEVAPSGTSGLTQPEREPVPLFFRDTEQPLLGMLLALVPLAHALRAAVWMISPPTQGGRAIATLSGLLAVIFYALWRHFAALHSDEHPAWQTGLGLGLAAGSVFVMSLAANDLAPHLPVAMAMLIVVRNNLARLIAQASALAPCLLMLDFSDPDHVLQMGSAIAVILAVWAVAGQRERVEGLRLEIRSQLVELTDVAEKWRVRQTAMIAGLAHDVRGPLTGASMAIELLEMQLGYELDPALREAGATLGNRCRDLAKRLTALIQDLRSRDQPPVHSDPVERASRVGTWQASEQMDVAVFTLTTIGLVVIMLAVHPSLSVGSQPLVAFALVAFYAAMVLGSPYLIRWYGTDIATWVLLGPALLWFGARSLEGQLSSDFALALSLFWMGAVASRSARGIVGVGAVMLALKIGAGRIEVAGTLIVAAIIGVAYLYRKSRERMLDDAADWSIRVDRRHTQVQRDTVEMNLSIAQEVRALRAIAHELVAEAGALTERARASGPDSAVEWLGRAHQALSGLEALIPANRSQGVSSVEAAGVTDWLSTVFLDRIQAKGGTMEVDVARGLTVSVPESTLKKVLINLVDNAVKFSPEGGRVFVGARTIPSERRVRFTVSDQGPGIAEADVGRMFSWFEQGPADTQPAKGGFGIGLGVVRDLVQENGGSIDVESQPGSTSIHVTLPG